MPIGQDVYNSDGAQETKVTYGPYHDFNGVSFPSTITIDRPLEEYRITLTVEKVIVNVDAARSSSSETKPCPRVTKCRRCPSAVGRDSARPARTAWA